MKLFGALMVLLSGLLLGLWRAGELKKREAALLALRKLIAHFRAGVRFSARPLGELVAEGRESPYCALALQEKCFPLEPTAALLRAGEQLLRDPGDLALYRELIKGLGATGREDQLEHLSLYDALLEERLRGAGEARERKGKLSVCMGLFGGVVLCLVLL